MKGKRGGGFGFNEDRDDNGQFEKARLEYDNLMTDEEKRQRDRDRAQNWINDSDNNGYSDGKIKRGPVKFSDLLNGSFSQEKRKRDFIYEDLGSRLSSIGSGISDLASDDTVRTIGFYVAIAALVGVVILGIVALVNHFNEQKPWIGTIAELHYRRDKFINQYNADAQETWWNTIPSLGYNSYYIGERVRSYHTEYYTSLCTKTETETDSKGHSTSHLVTYMCQKSRQVPDYDRWYGFTINEWVVIKDIFTEERQAVVEHTLQAVWPKPDGLVREFGTKNCSTPSVNGSEPQIISGPKTDLASQATDPLLGCQVVSPTQTEHYYITYHYEADQKPFSFECEIDYGTWAPLRVGKPAYGKYYAHNEGFDCRDGRIGIPPTETPKPS